MKKHLYENTRDWMSFVPNNKPLSHISIPGTHDSCARKGAALIDAFVATQNPECTILKQLEDGIRYLDIRCCAIDGVFTIHHDKFYLGINFGKVLEQCIHFLYEHPSEAIIMRIQQENSSVSDTEFKKIFDEKYFIYQKKMYMDSSIPTLGQVRGKIVILSNVLSISGINYRSIKKQDDYKNVSLPSKLGKIERFIDESVSVNKDGNHGNLYLNHCSATDPPWKGPESFAKMLVPNLVLKLKEKFTTQRNNVYGPPHIGILAMDFYTNDLIIEILKNNDDKNEIKILR